MTRCPVCGRPAWVLRRLGEAVCPSQMRHANSGGPRFWTTDQRLELVLKLEEAGAGIEEITARLPRARPGNGSAPLQVTTVAGIIDAARGRRDACGAFLRVTGRLPFAGHDNPFASHRPWRFSRYSCGPMKLSRRKAR